MSLRYTVIVLVSINIITNIINAKYSFQENLGLSHHIMLSVLTSLTCPIMPLWPGWSDDIWSWSRRFWSVLKLTLATRSCYQTQAGYDKMAQVDLSSTVKSGCSSYVPGEYLSGHIKLSPEMNSGFLLLITMHTLMSTVSCNSWFSFL